MYACAFIKKNNEKKLNKGNSNSKERVPSAPFSTSSKGVSVIIRDTNSNSLKL